MKTVKMNAPQWRTVLQWMAAIIHTHCKKSWERVNVNGVIPSKNVLEVLQDMASAADAARRLKLENEQLKRQLQRVTQTVKTNGNYWDCECKNDYINKKSHKTQCNKCGSIMQDQPDSIQVEIDKLTKDK